MNNQNNSSALSASEQQAVIGEQIRTWTKERDRLSDLIATAQGKNNSSAPNAAAIESAAKAIYVFFSGAETHPWIEGGNSFKQDEARRYARAALATQPPADRVQGGLIDVLRELTDAADTFMAGGVVGLRAAIDNARAILSRQSMTGGEIDERIAFEKFMSKRGWAAVYAGDGQYESPSVQDQWEAWQARAGISAPQEQAEHPSHETIISEGGKLVCTACGTTTPANAAAANGDWLLDVLRDMLAIQEACGLHTDEYAPGSVIEYIKELEADIAAAGADGQKGGQHD